VGLPRFLTHPDASIYMSDNFVVLDFETTNKGYGHARLRENSIVLSCWYSGRGGGGIECTHGDEFCLDGLKLAIANSDFIVAHNTKFELQWLERAGVDTSKVLPYCTMLGHYTLMGNRRSRYDLDSVAAYYGICVKKIKKVSSLITGGICPSLIPSAWLEAYCANDVAMTAEVFLRQREELNKLGLLNCAYTKNLAAVALADIETKGMCLDRSRTIEWHEKVEAEVLDLNIKLQELSGGVNWDSPKQVGAFLYDNLGFEEAVDYRGEKRKTKAGSRATDADTVSALIATTEEQRKFKELYDRYRPLDTDLATLKKLRACADTDKRILYFNFNQTVTQTHRLSSSGAEFKVQGQNIKREFKEMVKPRTGGWLIAESDGMQLEFRSAGHQGRDREAAKDIRDGVDVHRNTASILNKVPVDKVSKSQRQSAKEDTFKPLYGGNSGTPNQRKYYKWFREKYKGIYEAQTNWTYEVLAKKQLTMETGMVFYWPDTKMVDSGYITNTTNIFNYPIQYFATAEIIPISLIFVWHQIRATGLKMFIVNTIHDSIIAEIPPEERDAWVAICSTGFTSHVFGYLHNLYGIDFTVPLGVESKIGPRWGKGAEVKYELDPELI
jgi:DNA polymerase I